MQPKYPGLDRKREELARLGYTFNDQHDLRLFWLDARSISSATELRCERLAVEAGERPVGAALLRQAQELEVDLLVMGGYGRSRLSEMVLGGVTRHVLDRTELPVLLDH